MANLVSLVMQFLTPDMIRRIATALGLDRNNAHSWSPRCRPITSEETALPALVTQASLV